MSGGDDHDRAGEDGSYIVGYRRPPVSSQFVRGRSGNPKGRPKGSKNMLTLITAELESRVTVTENGKRRSLTKRQVVARQLVNQAAAGSLKAIPMLLGHALAHEQMEASRGALHETLSEADSRGMAGILDRLRTAPALVIDAMPVPLEQARQGSDREAGT